jgi:predicted ester cyclase
MYHKFLTPNAISHKYAFFIKSLSQQDWEILSNNVPEGIQIKPAVHFDIYDEYAVEDFKTILEKNLKQTNS